MRKIYCSIISLLLLLISSIAFAQDATEAASNPLENLVLSRYVDLEFESFFSYEFTRDNQFLLIKTETDIQFIRIDSLRETQEAFATIAATEYRISADAKWLFVPNETVFQVYDMQNISAEMLPIVSFDYAGTSRFYNFSEDERWLVLSYDNTLDLYDLSSLSAEAVPLISTSASRFRFNNDYSALAVLNSENQLSLYDLKAESVNDSAVVVATITGTSVYFGFNTSGTSLLFSSSTGTEFWDIASGTQTSYAWDMPFDGLYTVFSPDDRYLALDSYSCSPGYCRGEMRVLEMSSLEIIYTFPYDRAYVNAIEFSSDGNLLAFGSSTTGSWTSGFQTGTSFTNGVIHLINLETGEDSLNRAGEDGILGNIFFMQNDSRLIYSSIPFTGQSPDWSGAVIHVVDVSTGEDAFSFNDSGLAGLINPDNENQIQTTSLILLPGLFMFGGASERMLDLASSEDPLAGIYLGSYQLNQAETLLFSATFNYERSEGNLRFYAPDNGDILLELTINAINGFSELSLSPNEAYLAVKYTQGLYPDESYHLLILGLQ
jgi:WD40 repeat protein